MSEDLETRRSGGRFTAADGVALRNRTPREHEVWQLKQSLRKLSEGNAAIADQLSRYMAEYPPLLTVNIPMFAAALFTMASIKQLLGEREDSEWLEFFNDPANLTEYFHGSPEVPSIIEVLIARVESPIQSIEETQPFKAVIYRYMRSINNFLHY